MRFSKSVFTTIILCFLLSYTSRGNCIAESNDTLSFYISPDGDDSNEGIDMDQPLASLEGARNAIRTIKKRGELISPLVVYLREGIYTLSETLVLKPEDSGTEKFPVTYSAYKNEKPVLTSSAPGCLIKIEGSVMEGRFVEFLHITGLTFSGNRIKSPDVNSSQIFDEENSKNALLVAEGARLSSFVNNIFINADNYGMSISGEGIIIRDNEIRFSGGGGIALLGHRTMENTVSNNRIHHCGDDRANSAGIYLEGSSCVISGNLIYELPHYAICISSSVLNEQGQHDNSRNITIECNKIHAIGNGIDTCGGISLTGANAIIRNNYISNIIGHPEGVASAIMLGCNSTNVTLEDNILDRNNEGLTALCGLNTVSVENNFFINSLNSLLSFYNTGSDQYGDVRINRNIFFTSNMGVDIFQFQGSISLPAVSDNNLIWSTRECTHMRPIIWGIERGLFLETWKGMGFDVNTIVSNPLFKDPENGSFKLSPGSPAFLLGIKEIDMSCNELFPDGPPNGSEDNINQRF